MSLADIENLLRDRAVDTDADVTNAWDIRRNDLMTRIQAATREVFASAGSAFEGADELAAAVLALGYEMAHVCEVGAIRLDDNPDASEWRGKIDLGLQPLRN